jgi:hypothetical protein
MKTDTDYRKVISHIESFRDSKDLDSLEKFAGEIEVKWYRMNRIYYFDLILHICELFSSISFNDYDRQLSFTQKYANLALGKSGEIPLKIELHLLLHLQEDIEYLRGETKGEAWSRQRNRKAKMWFRGWHRLEQEIDPNFDFSDLPMENVIPPAGVDLRAGIAPEHIKDLKLRAEYEAAIAKNRQKAEAYNKQYKLRQLDKLFSPKAEQYIINAYSRSPFSLEELESYLELYIEDVETRSRILDAVKKKIANY